MPHGELSANAIRQDVFSELANVRFCLTRLPDEIHKHIAPDGAIYQVLANGLTTKNRSSWVIFCHSSNRSRCAPTRFWTDHAG
jgi:hypothetical protein